MASSLQGKTFGSYQILEPLGRGGMSQVYRAYHPNLNRYVAIKVLRSDLIEEESFLQRFQREAQAVAALRHPHIVQVYDFDVQDNTYYMVMELLEGDTLKTRLTDYRTRGERMPWGEMVRILLDVLDGLSYAHEEQMIHRDLKPANILLTKRGQAVLADFGIAQIIGSTRHTMSGALLGTLNYMAPEQGLEGKCDIRSDIYAIGIIFYEMLTQEPPFDADTPLAILMKHYNDPLPLPRQLDPDIPQAFEPIVLTALAKNPDNRYQSAEQMAAALRDAIKAEDIELPRRVSLPMSFTTTDAPSESVAVFSGAERARLDTAEFAHDATNITALKMAESAPPIMEQKTVHPHVIASETKRPLTQTGQQGKVAEVLTAVGIFLGINLLFFAFFGTDIGRFFALGWPIELFLSAYFFAKLMQITKAAGLFIPFGLMLSNGFFLGYTSLSTNWDAWANLWSIAVLLMVFFVVRTAKILQDDHTAKQWSSDYGRRFARLALFCAGVFFFITLTYCQCGVIR